MPADDRQDRDETEEPEEEELETEEEEETPPKSEKAATGAAEDEEDEDLPRPPAQKPRSVGWGVVLFALIVVVVVGGFYFGYWQPRQQRIAQQRELEQSRQSYRDNLKLNLRDDITKAASLAEQNDLPTALERLQQAEQQISTNIESLTASEVQADKEVALGLQSLRNDIKKLRESVAAQQEELAQKVAGDCKDLAVALDRAFGGQPLAPVTGASSAPPSAEEGPEAPSTEQ